MLEFMDLPQELLSEALKQACHNIYNRMHYILLRLIYNETISHLTFWVSYPRLLHPKGTLFVFFQSLTLTVLEILKRDVRCVGIQERVLLVISCDVPILRLIFLFPPMYVSCLMKCEVHIDDH